MKLLIVTVGKPLLFLVSRKEIKDPRELRGKKIAGSSPGGTATILAKQALKHYGLDPERDPPSYPWEDPLRADLRRWKPASWTQPCCRCRR